MPSDYQRNKRIANMKSISCHEEECPACKGKGEVMVKNTRVAGSYMKEHRTHDPNKPCSCPRSTISEVQRCVRCGGYGTISVRDAA